MKTSSEVLFSLFGFRTYGVKAIYLVSPIIAEISLIDNNMLGNFDRVKVDIIVRTKGLVASNYFIFNDLLVPKKLDANLYIKYCSVLRGYKWSNEPKDLKPLKKEVLGYINLYA